MVCKPASALKRTWLSENKGQQAAGDWSKEIHKDDSACDFTNFSVRPDIKFNCIFTSNAGPSGNTCPFRGSNIVTSRSSSSSAAFSLLLALKFALRVL